MIHVKEFKFDGGYDRIGIIRIGSVDCSICNSKNVDGIGIDNSEEEYKEGCICLECINNEVKIN